MGRGAAAAAARVSCRLLLLPSRIYLRNSSATPSCPHPPPPFSGRPSRPWGSLLPPLPSLGEAPRRRRRRVVAAVVPRPAGLGRLAWPWPWPNEGATGGKWLGTPASPLLWAPILGHAQTPAAAPFFFFPPPPSGLLVVGRCLPPHPFPPRRGKWQSCSGRERERDTAANLEAGSFGGPSRAAGCLMRYIEIYAYFLKQKNKKGKACNARERMGLRHKAALHPPCLYLYV